jgi:parallel beta-helix repeat protein
MRGKSKHLFITLTVGLGLILALLWLVSYTWPAHADPGTLYVAPDGDDAYDCASIANRCRTVQRAIDVADPFDKIWVATGTYTDAAGTVAAITRTVTLLGGWNDSFTTRDPNTYPATLDAQRNRRVVYISGDISPTVDGFTITGGNANSETIGAGEGGGIYSEDASPIIQNNVIISNMASISPTSGSGGGIYLESASASSLISGNQVVSNTACICWSAYGGGVHIHDSDATIQGNLIQSNTSGRDGGGVYISSGSPHFLDNEIRDNVAGRNAGGIYVYFSSSLIQDNLIIGNSTGAGWHGGAILVKHGSPTITANRIFSNTAFDSAGLGLLTGDYFTVTNNFIAHNDNGGIRLWELTRYGLIAHNTIAFNGGEGGICLHSPHITPTVVNNIVVSNTYGISAHESASGTLDYNDMWGNTTQDYDLPGALEPGPHDIQAAPLFVDLAGDDFHLQAGSPCIDAGTDVGVMSDIDGDPRRVGAGYDIGADEFRQRYIYLPLVEKNYP